MKKIILILAVLLIGCRKDDIFNSQTNVIHHKLNAQQWETIMIGETEWMKYNLCLTEFNDKTPIRCIFPKTDGSCNNDWWNCETSAYTYYGNNTELANKYGLLYNSKVITGTNSICPSGWRLPTLDDFKNLLVFLHKDGVHNQNHASEIKSPNGWISNSETNETLLSILGAGYISATGYSILLNEYTSIWCTTITNGKIHYLTLQNDNYIYVDNSDIKIVDIDKSYNYGFSIRLIKNDLSN